MTKVWKEAGFVDDDPWVLGDEDRGPLANGRVIQRINAFLDAVDSNVTSATPIGVLVEPSDDISKLEPYLERIALVAVSFSAFNDGRAFSQATLLRSRFGFSGEIRAVGDVLIDQIPLMLRCGIDSFAVANEVALKRLEQHRLNGIPLHYQPAARETGNQRPESYSWRRRA